MIMMMMTMSVIWYIGPLCYKILCNFSFDNIMMRIRKVKRLSESGFSKLINSKEKGYIFNSFEMNAFFADAKYT